MYCFNIEYMQTNTSMFLAHSRRIENATRDRWKWKRERRSRHQKLVCVWRFHLCSSHTTTTMCMLFLFVASYYFIDSYKLCVAFSFCHLNEGCDRKKSLLNSVYNKTVRHCRCRCYCRLLFLSLCLLSLAFYFLFRWNFLISIGGIIS